MTREQHLLIRAMEECNELAQRISKALVFGMEEVQPGQSESNRERIIWEFNDLVALMELCDFPLQVINGEMIDLKRAKVERYLMYSREQGLLT